MDAQDIAGHQLAAVRLRRVDDALGVRHRLGEGLFDKDVRARLDGADGVLRMRVRIGV